MDKLKPLKPCPFCGGKAEMLINEYNDSKKEYLVACTECDGMVERWRETEEEAVEQWNRRISDEEDAKLTMEFSFLRLPTMKMKFFLLSNLIRRTLM